MKLKHSENMIELTHFSKTIIGLICAIAFPILCISVIIGWFLDDFSNADWIDALFLVVFLIGYAIWLFKDFRESVLRYRITIDQNGVTEYRLLLKNKFLAWNDVQEYMCETTSAPYLTNEVFYLIAFYAKDERPPVLTWSFPERKKQEIQDAVFCVCDRFFAGWETCS